MDLNFLETFKDLALKNKLTDRFIEDRLSVCNNKRGHILIKCLKIPYLVMDIPSFDWKVLFQEAKNLESESVPHRSGDSQGWNSLCLHGVDAQKTLSCDQYGYSSEKQTPYQWTWVSEKAPMTTSYLKDLVNRGYFSEIYRIRFMYLQPGGFIKFHRDRAEGNHSLGPLNISLNMPKQCYWLFKKWGQVPFQPGMGVAVDISNEHGVWNFSKETRIHIIIHGVYGEEYYKTIKRSVEKKIKKISNSIKTNQALNYFSDQRTQETLSIRCLMWLQNHEIKDPELLRITSAITEHFAKLTASYNNDLDLGINLTNLLSRAYKTGKTWAVVITPGTILKSGFYESVKNFLSKSQSNVFMFAHLLDRKERWFGFHPQCFIVNLHLWNRLNRPPLMKKTSKEISVSEVIRSPENVHDDYTPVYLLPGNGIKKEYPKVAGWHWIHKALESGLIIENIPSEIREKKLFLYPEQNQESLLAYLETDLVNDKISTKKNTKISGFSKYFSFNYNGKHNQNWDQLSNHQKKVLNHLSKESVGLERKVFIFNTETVRSPYVEQNMKKIDAFVGLPSGFFDLHVLYQYGFHEETQLIYFDISQNVLDFKEQILELWDGKDYPCFVKRILHEYPKFNTSLVSAADDIDSHWQRELKIWGGQLSSHLTKVKALPRRFIKVNLIDDFAPLIKNLEKIKSKHIAFWCSNCFNYTPGLASQTWKYEEVKQKAVALLNHLLRLAEKNNLEITVHGENFLTGIRDTASFRRNIYDIFN